MKVDYLIVGQGLAGTLVAHNLLKRGKKVLVIDAKKENSSSRIAAGIFNPITGKRFVKTWMADTLFPFLETYYIEMEEFLQIKCLYQKSVFRPFDTFADENDWYGQSAQENLREYVTIEPVPEHIRQHYKCKGQGMYTNISGYVDVKLLIDTYANHLLATNCLLLQEFDFNACQISSVVQYKDIEAKAIIFTQGVENSSNPYFCYLPIEATKGEILDIEIDNYAIDSIVNKGVFVLPQKRSQRVGSTYDRDFENDEPTIQAANELAARLEAILRSPYKIIGHKAGVRPTVRDRKPLLGQHPKYSNLYIFNGLGTKGVSIGPLFSVMFSNFVLEQNPLLKEADIKRFDYLYHG